MDVYESLYAQKRTKSRSVCFVCGFTAFFVEFNPKVPHKSFLRCAGCGAQFHDKNSATRKKYAPFVNKMIVSRLANNASLMMGEVGKGWIKARKMEQEGIRVRGYLVIEPADEFQAEGA